MSIPIVFTRWAKPEVLRVEDSGGKLVAWWGQNLKHVSDIGGEWAAPLIVNENEAGEHDNKTTRS